MSSYKQCKKCGRSFPMTRKYFNENVTSKDGYWPISHTVEVAKGSKK